MFNIIIAISAVVIAGLVYFFTVLLKHRRALDGLPAPPRKHRLLGNLDVAGDCAKLFPAHTHAHSWFHYIQKKYGLGDCFYLDLWPFGPQFFITSNPEIASQHITATNSLPKSYMMVYFLNVFLGENNMICVEGNQWKQLRSMFNPGFSAQHLMTLVPYIVDASQIFSDTLRDKAETNELFKLEERATYMTIDIIGKVVLDADFNSQKTKHPIVETFRERLTLMPVTIPLFDISELEFRRKFKLWRNGRKLDRLIGEELDRRMAIRTEAESGPKSSKDRKRSVIDLAMDAYAKEQSGAGEKGDGFRKMDKKFKETAIDSLKTFIFAGHDTTSSTIAYVFYLLHLYPEAHKKIVLELDQVFSPNATTQSIATAIKADPHIINRLEYVTAVVKETLRIFPPASTLRGIPAESDPSKIQYMTHPVTGQKLPLSGYVLWPAVTLISRNEEYFPEPLKFIPERFIPSKTPFPNSKLFTPAGKDAWRPFERGPRNCIGQELAMIESKVIVAMTVKDLDFVAEYDGIKCENVTPVDTATEYADGKPGKERMTIEGHRCYQELKGIAKPAGGMPGRMYLRK